VKWPPARELDSSRTEGIVRESVTKTLSTAAEESPLLEAVTWKRLLRTENTLCVL
jgi:hypothetical protein